MNEAERFVQGAKGLETVTGALHHYQSYARSGYLTEEIFERFCDGKEDPAILNWLAGPWPHVRTWVPEMHGRFFVRFHDSPYIKTVAENLGDECGLYRDGTEGDTHAELYARVMRELGVPIKQGTLSTPEGEGFASASTFYGWFREQMDTLPEPAVLGHLLAYEVADDLDFTKYEKAATRLWPGRDDLLEFFLLHRTSGHDETFAERLQPLYEQDPDMMLHAMGNMLPHWRRFYQESWREAKRAADDGARWYR